MNWPRAWANPLRGGRRCGGSELGLRVSCWPGWGSAKRRQQRNVRATPSEGCERSVLAMDGAINAATATNHPPTGAVRRSTQDALRTAAGCAPSENRAEQRVKPKRKEIYERPIR